MRSDMAQPIEINNGIFFRGSQQGELKLFLTNLNTFGEEEKAKLKQECLLKRVAAHVWFNFDFDLHAMPCQN